jgi:hypothetical protein
MMSTTAPEGGKKKSEGKRREGKIRYALILSTHNPVSNRGQPEGPPAEAPRAPGQTAERKGVKESPHTYEYGKG